MFAVLLTVFTGLVYAPGELYLNNSSEFWFSWSDICVFLAEAVAIVILVFVLVRRKVSEDVFMNIQGILYGLTFCLFIQGTLLPYDYGILNGEEISWDSYGIRSVYNTAMWIAIIAAMVYLVYRFGEKGLQKMRVVGGIVLFMQIGTLVFACVNTASSQDKIRHGYVSNDGEYELASEKNTIVLVFDSFDSQLMQELIRDYPDEVRESLKDFTYYHNTIGTSSDTRASVPAYLYGDVNKTGVPYKDYISTQSSQSKLIKELGDEKYDAGFYMEENMVGQPVRDVMRNHKQGRVSPLDQAGIGIKYLQLVAFKYSPHVLKRFFWLDTGEFDSFQRFRASDFFDERDPVFYAGLVKTGLSAGDKKEGFRYYHLKGVHLPYDMNELGQAVEPDDTDRYREGRGCLQIVRTYKEELKKAGLYDNCAFIVMADHGWGYEKHTNPLFMIKQRGADKEYEVSEAPISLFDLPDMLCDFLRSDVVDIEGEFGNRSERVWYDKIERGGKNTIYEYVTSGTAYDWDSFHDTGKTYEWRY